ncbi:hypothetical protein [Thiolapillus brandeum]|uniref:DUF2282 domain-containing protein n=1 Tax=Thiolapillus brandeum TaxID=1076588 RepID=A0A7U6GJ79_9GAMM|nr:hypothetical protein [Thiolapillus brandeum]BAO44640.1 hypothetical protein TBH_C1723 [Thiolapillus brandeum]
MKNIIMPITTVSTLLFLSLTSGAGLAEGNVCKGMEHSACSKSTTCRWIKPYKRTDGLKVTGYCRKLPERKTQASQEQGKGSASKKS